MRCYKASTARILTLFALALLASHSFTLVSAQGSESKSSTDVSPSSQETEKPSSTPPPPPSSTPPSSTPPSSKPTTPPPSSKPTTSPSSTPPPSTTPPPESSSESSSQSSSASSVPVSVSSSSASQPSVTPTSISQPSGTLVVASNTAATNPSASYKRISSTLVIPPASNTPVVTGTTANGSSAASKGFWQNTGAVAATFTVVGLVGLAIIFVAATYYMRRRNRRREEEDDMYFEKYQDTNPAPHHHHSPSSFTNLGGLGNSATDLTTTAHAPVDAYPDRTIHYGATDHHVNESAYDGMDNEVVEYPPHTAFAAAASQQGQYQYHGQGGAGAYPSGQPTSSYHGAHHPFADPGNVANAGGAPQINRPYAHHLDSYYGGNSSGMGRAQ